jgi:dolichyl-phosphate beta-glucosyltransferase
VLIPSPFAEHFGITVLANIFLSIIIPAYNEERRLPVAMQQAFDFLQTQPYSYEVLIVENGSMDRTYRVAQEFAIQHPEFRVLQSEQGKGAAVRKGMLEARGEFRFMCDADLSMPVSEVNRFLPPALTGFDLAIASREARGAIRYHEPLYRHLGGRFINLMIRLLALPGLQDTQCGFKCFPAQIAQDLFRCQTMPGWSFDVELLYIARLRRYRVVEVPISWYFNADSKINPIRDAWRMVLDILEIRRKARQGIYNLPR